MVLDPLTALGLASNVVQLVDYSLKLVSRGNALYKSKDGALLENREMAMIADDLSRLTGRLYGSLAIVGKKSVLTADEVELKVLSEACEAMAQELLDALDNLKVKGKPQRWKSFRKALASVWDKEKIDGIVDRLSKFRAQLDTHILLSLRTSIDILTLRQSQVFETLDTGIQSIINTLLGHQKSLSVEFTDAYLNVGKGQAHTEAIVTEEHAKTRAEIIEVIREGRTTDTATQIQNALDASKFAVPMSIEQRILESLRFRAMPDRHDEIPASHRRTFEWVYRDSTQETKSWSNFAEWLRRDDGIFWIAGKAGSGKSTLMKYLYDNPKTREELLHWSKGTPLITAAFFFWKTGTSMQKSQAGLLQSLLHETLSQCEELIPIVIPWRYKEYQAYGNRQYIPYDAGEWTRAELSRAFTTLVTQKVLPAKFCFLIDGLDEYDGDPSAILALFKEIPRSSSIKICVSSRPLVVCEEAFDRGPMLMLQDLTYHDIELYVSDMLGENERMLQLKKEETETAPQLVTEIVDRASGVFLWVKLVVRSLLDGLRNYDRISDLQERLRILPVDLEDLYWHMLKDVEPFYRAQAWRLFQIVRQARNPLTSLLLSFADEDRQTTLQSPRKVLSPYEIECRCKAMQRRLKSRCKGLLEVQSSHQTQLNSKVLFLHRSVDDFLQKQEVQDMLLSNHALSWLLDKNKHGFDAQDSLMRAYLMRLKQPEPQSLVDRLVLLDTVSEFLQYAAAAEEITGEDTIPFIKHFDETAQTCWRDGRFSLGKESPSIDSDNEPRSWVESLWTTDSRKERVDSFLTLAIQFGLSLYVKHALAEENKSLLKKPHSPPLLEYAIAPRWKKLPRPVSVKMVKVFLESGANPNETYQGLTPWQNVLAYIYASLPTCVSTTEDVELIDTWFEICKLFLQHGADTNVCCNPGQKFGSLDRNSLPASEVLAITFSKLVILKWMELDALLVQKSKEEAEKAGTTVEQKKSVKEHELVLPRLHAESEERVAKLAGTRVGESVKQHVDEWGPSQIHLHSVETITGMSDTIGQENIADSNEDPVEERADKGTQKNGWWILQLFR